MTTPVAAAPRASLSVLDGVAIMVGIVIGIGIFKTPALVAANVGSETALVGAWILGGAITLIGALVYAELGATYPCTGGEYRFLSRAFGQSTAFLFAWARISVIQTGAIAAVAFVFGDYAQQIHPLGDSGPALYAASVLVLLTLLNLVGTAPSKGAQNVLTGVTLLAIGLVALVGINAAAAAPVHAVSEPLTLAPANSGAFGLAMIFILLTYGGWNEVAYLSAEVRDSRRNMARVLVYGTLAIIGTYLLINFAFLRVLGLDALRASDAVAADMMRKAVGEGGALALSFVICCTALSTLNGTIFTGARVYHAVGEDMRALRSLGRWNGTGNNPRAALLVQGAIALLLIGFGAFTQDGFKAMVDYTAPVFWLFLLLVGVSFFVLRRRDPQRERPFRTPLYPLTPALFCLTCAYLLYSSLAYTGLGALIGVGVLLSGVPLLWVLRRRQALAAPE